MQLLSPEDLANMRFKNAGLGVNAPEYQPARKLDIGQSLLITTSEWKQITKPNVFIGKIAKRDDKKFQFRTLLDKSGWVVTRIK